MNIREDVEIEIQQESDTWQDVLRCLKILYGSRVGSLALDREFGIDWSFLDMPMEAAKAYIESELITKTRTYEPRAAIERVEWSGDAEGGLINPKVVINIV